MIKRKALIFGLKGTTLTKAERKILNHNTPWGIILFSRNIKNIIQLKSLISDIRKNTKDLNYPILIDQEGGSVSRLNKIIDFSFFSQKFIGELYSRNMNLFYHYYQIYTDIVCGILRMVGININTVPVLDVRRKYSHKIIFTRSFSSSAAKVSKIGKISVELYNKNKIATVVKHIPGHGLSKQDSHFKLPIVNLKKKLLIKKDFLPFKNTKSLFAMTAHVVYSSYDSLNAATHSKIIINKVIRKHIGFKGIIISDDISMKALKHGLIKNATKALDAGCNLILHCNGNIKEMRELIKFIPTIDRFTQKKTSLFYNFLR